MPRFHGLDGQQIQYGNPGEYAIDDEKAFLISFEKQLRTADMANPEHVTQLQNNFNEIASIIGVAQVPVHGTMDTTTADALRYYEDNRGLFMQYGVSNHLKAKEIEQVTESAFTETEHAPTIDEMKELEIDISELYNDRS